MQNASENRFCQKILAKSEPRGAYSAGAYKKKRVDAGSVQNIESVVVVVVVIVVVLLLLMLLLESVDGETSANKHRPRWI